MNAVPADPFALSSHLKISSLFSSTIIPSFTKLSGTVSLVWGDSTSNKWTGHAITFFVKAKLAAEPSAQNDYVTTLPKADELSVNVRCLLRPSKFEDENQDGLIRLEEERKQLLTLVGKVITIDCSGMVVEKVDKQGNGLLVHLEGSGERYFATKSFGIIKVPAGGFGRIVACVI